MEKTLYGLTVEQEQINAMLEENGGELTPEMEAMLVVNAENANVKLEGYCKAVANYSAYIESLKKEAKRLTEKAKVAENTVDRLKHSMLTYLLASGQKKVNAGVFTVSWSESHAVSIIDEALVPDKYKKTTIEVSKTDVKKDLSSGIKVPGVTMINNKNLQIK